MSIRTTIALNYALISAGWKIAASVPGGAQAQGKARAAALQLQSQGYQDIIIVTGHGPLAPKTVIYDPNSGGAGSGGGGGGTGAGAGGAGAATQTQRALTGGGAHWKQGALAEGLVATRLDDEYMGLDTLTAPEKLPPGMSPYAPGIDQVSKLGSRCKRHGSAKLTMDRDSVTLSSSAINAAYRGLGLAVMPSSGDNPDQMLLSFADNDIGQTRSSIQTALLLVTNKPRWGRPVNLADWPGPTLTLTDQGSQVMRVTAVYSNVFDQTNQLGVQKNSVKQIVIRYSTVGFPRDIDGLDDDRDGAGYASTALADRTSWLGTSTSFNSGTLTAARYYVTAWAISAEGVSEPSFGSITLA